MGLIDDDECVLIDRAAKVGLFTAELTVAGNLKDMFARMTPADDLTFRHGIDAPTIRVDGMTVAGQ